MEKLNHYKKIITEEMQRQAARKTANMPEVENLMVIDEKRLHFIMVATGLYRGDYIHEWLYHLQLKNGKILIHEDCIDPGIYERLVKKGIPEKDILPLYLPDFEPAERRGMAAHLG